MPDMTTHEAAAYLAFAGYTVKRRRIGGEGPPSAGTIKLWCVKGKFQGARKSGRVWLIPEKEIKKMVSPPGLEPGRTV